LEDINGNFVVCNTLSTMNIALEEWRFFRPHAKMPPAYNAADRRHTYYPAATKPPISPSVKARARAPILVAEAVAVLCRLGYDESESIRTMRMKRQRSPQKR